MPKKCKAKIAIRFPQNENIDFNNPKLTSDLNSAVQYYAKKYGGYQKITILAISKSIILIEIEVVDLISKLDPSRLISAFSRYLYNHCGWDKLSKIKNRLFYIVESDDVSNDTDDLVLEWLYLTQKIIALEIQKRQQQII